MLKVLIVDDEPFIALGLGEIIEWNKEGYEVVYTAYNGLQALEYVKENPVDLIIADIQMPVMNGLELLEEVRKINKDTFFVILSGFDKFDYVQRALRSNCTDYILKPVQQEELLEIVRRIALEKNIARNEEVKNKEIEKNFIEHNIRALLNGKYNDETLKQINNSIEKLVDAPSYRYVNVYPMDIGKMKDMDDEEIKNGLKKLKERLINEFPECEQCFVLDTSLSENEYELGFVISSNMLCYQDIICRENSDEEKIKLINQENIYPVSLVVGKEVDNLNKIHRSYSSTFMMRSFIGFFDEKYIYVYEDEVLNNSTEGAVLCTDSLENLIKSIAINDKDKIKQNVELLFNEMEKIGFNQKNMSINMNYLLYRLIYLAVEQDETVNQEEVMQYISENTFEDGINRGGKDHFLKFANEYAEYIIQLRKKVSRGVLSDIEKEIHENYASNLTLRELSKKYFINSSYLGQIFRKKYGISFKDYLCEYRIDKAAYELLHTDKKIVAISEEVGYKDIDYFISKFTEKKGCPPAKYRRGVE